MQLTGVALGGMTIQPPETKEEDRITEFDVNASGKPAVGQLMKYGTLNKDKTVKDGPARATVDDSLKWGIRWLAAKRTRITNSGGKLRDWWGSTGALKRYNGEKGKEVSYPLSIQKLYEEGKKLKRE